MESTSTDTGKVVLRLAIGGLLLLHGISKLMNGIDGLLQMHEGKGLPGFIAYGVYIGEVVAPLLVILGFRARLAGLIISFNMLWAILFAHTDEIFSLGKSGGWAVELPALFLLGGIAIYFLGAGRYAVSNRSRWD